MARKRLRELRPIVARYPKRRCTHPPPPECAFDQMPVEILELVFTNIEYHGLYAISCVNKRFRQVLLNMNQHRLRFEPDVILFFGEDQLSTAQLLSVHCSRCRHLSTFNNELMMMRAILRFDSLALTDVSLNEGFRKILLHSRNLIPCTGYNSKLLTRTIESTKTTTFLTRLIQAIAQHISDLETLKKLENIVSNQHVMHDALYNILHRNVTLLSRTRHADPTIRDTAHTFMKYIIDNYKGMINMKDSNQELSFNIAITCSMTPTAIFLIENGADVLLKDWTGNNALLLAIKYLNKDVLKSMINMNHKICTKAFLRILVERHPTSDFLAFVLEHFVVDVHGECQLSCCCSH